MPMRNSEMARYGSTLPDDDLHAPQRRDDELRESPGLALAGDRAAMSVTVSSCRMSPMMPGVTKSMNRSPGL